tara:strand:- start:66 stop:659 length:594 start_codon:yes stop_codon:yes gene_type:complete
MKKLLLILILTLSFQTWIKADDIRDFKIEGISIGDSLLDYLSEVEINKKIIKQDYTSDRFKTIFINSSHILVNIYDGLYFDFKKNDNKYIIQAIAAKVDYENLPIIRCLDKKKEIVSSIKLLFPNSEPVDDTQSHPSDETGKSKVYRTSFGITNSNWLSIEASCFSWDKKIIRFSNHLRVSVKSDEYNVWLRDEAYK